MNWIPKEKGRSRKPTDKEKMKEFFRKNRAALPSASDPVPTHEDGRAQLVESRFSGGSSGSRELLDEGRRSSSRSKSSPSSTDQGLTGRHEPETPLCEMNLRTLSRTIGKSTAAVSSELVNLEIMKKMHSYRPRPASPDYNEDDQIVEGDVEQTAYPGLPPVASARYGSPMEGAGSEQEFRTGNDQDRQAEAVPVKNHWTFVSQHTAPPSESFFDPLAPLFEANFPDNLAEVDDFGFDATEGSFAGGSGNSRLHAFFSAKLDGQELDDPSVMDDVQSGVPSTTTPAFYWDLTALGDPSRCDSKK